MTSLARGAVVAGLAAALLLVSACSNVVRLPDCIDCRPVEMSLGQTFEVELYMDRAVTNDPEAFTWVVAEAGTMTLVSEERRTEEAPEDEVIGGHEDFMILRFEPTEAGTTQMRFEFIPTDEPEGLPGTTLDISVIVTE